MYKIIYLSIMNVKFSDIQLEELLEKSRLKNKNLEITGLLIVKGERFIQWVEEPKENVEKLYETISKDPRHHSIMTILEEEIEKRTFKDWSMGYKNIAQLDTIESEKIKNFNHDLENEDIPELFKCFVESEII